MKGHFLRSYRKLSKNGQPLTVFVYTVSGSDDELEQFQDAQGADNYRESDDGEPLWFTTRVAGPNPTLLITAKGAVVADMSAFDKAHSLAQQYGGSLGSELAKQAAALLTGSRPPDENQDSAEKPAKPSKKAKAEKPKAEKPEEPKE